MSKKILVTGGAGFIGSNFVSYLLQNTDYEVFNLDKLTYAGNLANLAPVSHHKRYSFIKGDISDAVFVDQLFSQYRFNFVINFAAETHVDRSIADSDPFVATNIIGTHNLLKSSVKYQLERYHQVSTDEVYGDLGDPEIGQPRQFFTEDTPIAPNCPYAAAKASADLLVMGWYHTYSLPIVITRCSNNYGPYQFPEKLIPFLVFHALKNKPLPIYGDGQNIRDWLYVLDHCQAILLAFEKSPSGEIWNIGGHNEYTNIQIANLVLKHTKSNSKIIFTPDRLAHDRRYAMDASKISRQLGWKPKHTFDQALPKTIQWYLDNSDWLKSCPASSLSL